MSNKRNKRRGRQRVRSELNRKPGRVTKAMDAFVASQPGERERKERERYWKKPTKAEAREREVRVRRWRVTGKPVVPRSPRKRRTKYGRTYYTHSLDN